MYSPPSSGSGKAVAYKLYLYIYKFACTVGGKKSFLRCRYGLRSRPSLLIRIWIPESFTDQKKIFYRKNRSRISFDTLLLRSVNFLPCLVQIQQNQIQFSKLFLKRKYKKLLKKDPSTELRKCNDLARS